MNILMGIFVVKVNNDIIFTQLPVGILNNAETSCCNNQSENIEYKQEDDKK